MVGTLTHGMLGIVSNSSDPSAFAPGSDASGSSLPPQGWYPDPANSDAQRFWDGSQWTDQSRALQPADWYTDPADIAGQRFWDGNAWTEQTRPAPLTGPGAADPWAPTSNVPGAPSVPGAPTTPVVAPTPGVGQGSQSPWGQNAPAAQQPVHNWSDAPGQYPYSSRGGFSPYGGPATADGVRLASWGARFGSLIIDQLILGVLNSIILWVMSSTISDGLAKWWADLLAGAESGSLTPVLPTDAAYGDAYWQFMAVTAVVGFSYATLMQKFRAATLGQMVFGLRVVPTDHGAGPYRLGWSTALIRNGAWLLIQNVPLVSTLLMLINGLMPLFQRKRQTLHDLVARTQVVTLRP